MEFAIARSAVPESDRMKILLSYKAGLRAGEIAKITVAQLTNANGKPAKLIEIHGGIAKGGRSREIPMHPLIADALVAFCRAFPKARHVALSPRSTPAKPKPTNAGALTTWFHRLYSDAGCVGASSHSGRRYFATAAAQECYRQNATIVDVQRLLGHAYLSTTERYIEPSRNTFNLVAAL